MKQRIGRLPEHPTTVDKLWQAVQRLWDELLQSILDNPIYDMPRHREDLRRAKGSAVKG